MEKMINSIKVNTETGQLFSGDYEIKCPYDVVVAFETLSTFEYLKDMFSNDDETLWKVSFLTRQIMNDYLIFSEEEAISKASEQLNITLIV